MGKARLGLLERRWHRRATEPAPLDYDAENRLVAVSGDTAAWFVYDGNGQRVKQTMDGIATYFVGNIYQSASGMVTKYYYAGASRVAMRVNGTLYYLLSDHLGSTTVTTDVNGYAMDELKYKPWGEVRAGSAPTNYTFTGQYSNTSDFGLMYYNARWMDPDLGRFASADTVVPAGLQGYDRYAYVNNSPVNFTDPSGHEPNWKLRHLKRDYGRYWNDVKGAWHREGDGALLKWSNRIAEEKAQAEAAAQLAGMGGGGKLQAPMPTGPHLYITINMVCAAVYDCSRQQIWDYLQRFVFPGQDPALPVVDKQLYFVHAPVINVSLGVFGAIRVYEDEPNLSVTNVTQAPHVFFYGKATRSAWQGESGAWYVTTVSYGFNVAPKSEMINAAVGPSIFNGVDGQMRDYITAAQLQENR